MATPVTEEEKLAQRSAEAAGGIDRNMPKMQQPEDTEEDVVEENGTYSRKDAALRGNNTTNGVTAPQPQLTTTEKRESQPTLEDIERATHPHETDEQKAAREKREKRNKLLATIGDGLAAFHEAYEMNRGRKPIVQVGLSERMQKYYDQMRLQRERREREYNNAILRARMADEANLVNMRRQDRLERETAIKEAKAESDRLYRESMADKNWSMAEYYRAKRQALEEGKSLDEAIKAGKAALAKAQANQANETARLRGVQADKGGFANATGAGMGEYTTKKWKNGKLVEETQRTVGNKSQGSQNGGSTSNKGGSLLPNQDSSKTNEKGSLLPSKK